MNPRWIAHRYPLADVPHRLDDDGVVPRESLAIVRDASTLIRRTRHACAGRLRRARRLHQDGARRAMESLQARAQVVEQEAREAVLGEAVQLLNQLRQERIALRQTVHALAADVIRQAAQRLLLEVPADWPIASSVELVLADWQALELKDEFAVRVHPEDLALVSQLSAGQSPPAFDAAAARPSTLVAALGVRWSVRPDASLHRGECVLRHSAGSIHADFPMNVSALCAALTSLEWRHDPTQPDAPASLETPEPVSTSL